MESSVQSKSPSNDNSKQMLDELVSRALAYRSSQDVRELLSFVARFPYFAPYNAMLLHVQNRGIRYALRIQQWETEYGRRVRPGARPYVVLRTMGPVDFVFDLSDTVPIDPSDDRIPKAVGDPFPATGKPPPHFLGKLITASSLIGISISFEDFGSHAAGAVQRTLGFEADYSIQLNQKHTDAQRLGALAHELGHVFCGHLGETKKGFWPDRSHFSNEIHAFEAEAVAYIVTKRINLEIGSAEYLAEYLKKDTPLPDYSLEAILKAAGKIEQMASGRYRPKKK